MGTDDEGANMTWEKLLKLIFILLAFIVLFALLALALYMPLLRS